MNKTTSSSILAFDKQALRRMNRDTVESIDKSELEGVTGGFSQRCPNCTLSSTTNAADASGGQGGWGGAAGGAAGGGE